MRRHRGRHTRHAARGRRSASGRAPRRARAPRVGRDRRARRRRAPARAASPPARRSSALRAVAGPSTTTAPQRVAEQRGRPRVSAPASISRWSTSGPTTPGTPSSASAASRVARPGRAPAPAPRRAPASGPRRPRPSRHGRLGVGAARRSARDHGRRGPPRSAARRAGDSAPIRSCVAPQLVVLGGRARRRALLACVAGAARDPVELGVDARPAPRAGPRARGAAMRRSSASASGVGALGERTRRAAASSYSARSTVGPLLGERRAVGLRSRSSWRRTSAASATSVSTTPSSATAASSRSRPRALLVEQRAEARWPAPAATRPASSASARSPCPTSVSARSASSTATSRSRSRPWTGLLLRRELGAPGRAGARLAPAARRSRGRRGAAGSPAAPRPGRRGGGPRRPAAAAAELAAHLAEQVVEPQEVALGRLEPALGPLPALAVLQDAGRLLDDRAAVLGPGVEHRVDLALADDHVLLAADAGVGEQLLDVEQPARRAVDRVLAVARRGTACG